MTPTPARGHRSPGSSHRRALFAGLALLLVALVAAFARAIVTIDAPPRSMAPYIERRLAGHHPLLVRSGAWLARFLTALDRGESRTPIRLSLRAGAQQEASPLPPPSAVANRVGVASPEQALRAIGRAQPGDVIILEPGTYRFSGASIFIRQAGTPDAGITVRASRPRTVFIEMDNLEGFVVSAPYWRFENLTIRGVCARHSECDHAFHVVGAATHFVARNNTLIDFNAHIKVNGEGRHFPDDGLIEGNTLSDSAVRQTESPVTTVDLVAASRWTVRGNLITDFIKAGGDRISYGAFAKGGGSGNRFERNVVLCEYLLRGAPGSRVGISLGGGGTAREYCRDGACVVEQDGGSVESNLIASCSDDGIYVNRSAQSRIVHNTLIDTGGIVVRFAESSADVEGNLVDGAIRSRDGGLLHADDNLQTDLSALYFGYHPQRRLFRDALALDLAWATKAPRRASPSPPPTDLCESTRPPQPVYGAFEGIEACLGAATEVGR